MISHLFFYQLVLIALVWLFLMLHYAWPSDRPPHQSPPARLTRRRQRSTAPTPFAGLTQQPHCALCEQETVEIAPAPPIRPHPISPTNRRPREVDTSMHFCPHRGCDYRGWLGLGNLRANGLPTICQPSFVNFFTPSARLAHDESGSHHSRYVHAAWPSGYATTG